MEEENITEIYKIDRDRLYGYYERIKNQFAHKSDVGIVAKFLINRSIGNKETDVEKVLNYFNDKIIEGKNILDFAFEWIRAQKIRLEYKKYLIRTIYPNDDINLAIDDCIILFFLGYDKYLRTLLKNKINEHEISALFEIFFSPYEIKTYDINNILKNYSDKVPTIYIENERIDTNIVSLRLGLSNVIKSDYEGVIRSRLESKQSKEIKFGKVSAVKKEEEIREFNGTNLERILKTYCFNRKELEPKVIETAVTNFLTSYFMFGKFYEYDEFNEILADALAEYVNLGLTDRFKKNYPADTLVNIINERLLKFRSIHQIKKLDGVAWINDLKPVLKRFIINFTENLFEQREQEKEIPAELIEEPPIEKVQKEVEVIDGVNFSEVFDLNLDVDEYRNKLEALLVNSNKGMIERRNIMRQKVQEFIIQKRKR